MSLFNMKPSRKWSELLSLPLLCSIVLSVLALRSCAADDEGQVGEGAQFVDFPHNHYYDSYIQPHRAEGLVQTARQRRQVDTETLAGLGYANGNPAFRRSPSTLYSFTPPNVYAERQSHRFSALKSESAPSYISNIDTSINPDLVPKTQFNRQLEDRQAKVLKAFAKLRDPKPKSKTVENASKTAVTALREHFERKAPVVPTKQAPPAGNKGDGSARTLNHFNPHTDTTKPSVRPSKQTSQRSSDKTEDPLDQTKAANEKEDGVANRIKQFESLRN